MCIIFVHNNVIFCISFAFKYSIELWPFWKCNWHYMNNYVGIYVYISSKVFKIMETLIIFFKSIHNSYSNDIDLKAIFVSTFLSPHADNSHNIFFKEIHAALLLVNTCFVYDCNSVRTCLFQILFLITYFKRLVYH